MDLEGLQECRKQTKQNILKLLETNNRVGCVRWTGFGKSHMINELYEELPGEKLILTSTTALRDEFRKQGCNCYTYGYLHFNINNHKFLNKFNNIYYLFLDECHRVSPNNLWGQSLEKFINKLNCKLLGFTATPNRGVDRINVIDYWFEGIQIDPMTLEDAYKLNYINEISYIKSYFNVSEIKEELNKEIKRNEYTTNQYNLCKVELNNIYGIKEIIKKHYNKDNNGTKIIVFCNRLREVKHIKNYYFKIFKEIYPNEEINTYTLSYKDTTNDPLDDFKENNSGIDLMFTVDKLGEGIHIEKVNTIIFMRPTMSETKYFQQLGRGINGNKRSLIFDFANNCDRVVKNIDKNNKYPKEGYRGSDEPIQKLLDLVEVVDYSIKIDKVFDIINGKVTEEQRQYLKENAMNKTIKELSDYTGIPKERIRYFFYSENIDYKKESDNYNDYSYVDAHCKDKTIKELSDDTGIPEGVIRTHLNKAGKEYKRAPKKYDYSYIDIHYKDKTIKELSDDTGIPEDAVRHYCSFKNLDYKKERLMPIKEKYNYINKYHKDKTVKELSDDTGIPIVSIYRYYRKEGITDYKRDKYTYDYSYIDVHYKDKTANELSDDTGIPVGSIYNYYKSNNINDYKVSRYVSPKKKGKKNNGRKSNNR